MGFHWSARYIHSFLYLVVLFSFCVMNFSHELMRPCTLLWAGLLLPGCKMQGRDVRQGHSHASGLLQSNTIVVPVTFS